MALFEEFHDARIGQLFVDLTIEYGEEEASKVIQRAVNRVTGELGLGLKVDGEMGEEDLLVINQMEPEFLIPQIKIYGAQYKHDKEWKENHHGAD